MGGNGLVLRPSGWASPSSRAFADQLVASRRAAERLPTYGLLRASFRPEDRYCVLHTYLRYRDELGGAKSIQCQHMKKALQELKMQVHHVLSDVTGLSGLTIIKVILDGEREPVKLASMVDRRVRASLETIQKALRGDYRPEHLFVLQAAFDLYHTFEAQMRACDERLVVEVAKLPAPAEAVGKPVALPRTSCSARICATCSFEN